MAIAVRARARCIKSALVAGLVVAACSSQPVRAARVDIEILAGDDSSFTYRERVPPRVAMDAAHGVYHVAGCPSLAPAMPWTSPGMATLRGLKPHACAAHPIAEYAMRTERRCAHDAAVVSVLFVGNSLTYYNQMPRLFAKLGEREARPLRVDRVTMSGASLDQLWTSTRAPHRIWAEHWDYVVLQERGGSAPRTPATRFEESLQRFAEQVRKSGARPLVFMTWDSGDEEENERLFARAAARAGATVVPVGSAWHDLLASRAFSTLQWDGWHPDLAGSYLIACAMYSAIYGRSPVGLPFDFTGMGNPDETYDAALRAHRLLPHQARAIQLAAWAAWQRWQR